MSALLDALRARVGERYATLPAADRPELSDRHGRYHGSAHALGGSISAEHGIGQRKRDVLPRYKSLLELELMRRIKQALDPHNLLNPGKVLVIPS